MRPNAGTGSAVFCLSTYVTTHMAVWCTFQQGDPTASQPRGAPTERPADASSTAMWVGGPARAPGLSETRAHARSARMLGMRSATGRV